MKIALLGYGKMGKMVEKMALKRGHEVVCRLDIRGGEEGMEDVVSTKEEWGLETLAAADVVIEFTMPTMAEMNVRKVLAMGVKVVCGTTGWVIPEDLQALMKENKWVWKSNYSVGVNVMMEVSKILADKLSGYGYQVSMEEVHHVHKLDKPSGTAKTLAEKIGYEGEIVSRREGEVPGIHTVVWTSDVDKIVLTHEAFGRESFALGAVLEAERLMGVG